MRKTTLTLRELQLDLRDRGIQMSQKAISKGISSGLFPFARVTNVGETGRMTFFILQSDYESWADKAAPKA